MTDLAEPRTDAPPAPPARTVRGAWQRVHRVVRTGPLFGAVWLVYLGYPWTAAWQAPHGATRTLALVCVVVFAVVFVVALRVLHVRRGPAARVRARWQGWAALGVEALLVVGMAPAAQESALAGLVFMAVLAVFVLPVRQAIAVALGLVVLGEGLPRVVDGWEADAGIGVQTALATIAIIGVTQVMARNAELAAARTELADLAVARERERMARDVHDLLGHSLTVITVKSELAGRLLALDPAAAAREVADIESLARAALADVRATVRGFRAVSLAGELASARAALAAVGIDARLPAAVDDVPDDLRELFAWTVREGVTNVVRHSGARRCSIDVSPSAVVVSDDGGGPGNGTDAAAREATARTRAGGTGLLGLQERAREVGAVVSAARSAQGGFELRVAVDR